MEHILVVQDASLVTQLKNKSIIVETNMFDNIEEIRNLVQVNNNLFCIKIITNQIITKIDYKEEWQNIPLVVYPKALGKVRDLTTILSLLKKLNIKFFLSTETKQNIDAIQILSSLGIYSGVVITENTDWTRLTDLMYYALCGKVPHAPIEPFQYVYDIYAKNTLVDYETVWFNNPQKYLYIDKDGQVALTQQDLTEKNFIMSNIAELQLIENEPSYQQQVKSWQKFFYEPTKCATCAAWRICLGKYSHIKNLNLCQSFMSEVLGVIENRKFNKHETK